MGRQAKHKGDIVKHGEREAGGSCQSSHAAEPSGPGRIEPDRHSLEAAPGKSTLATRCRQPEKLLHL